MVAFDKMTTILPFGVENAKNLSSMEAEPAVFFNEILSQSDYSGLIAPRPP